MTSTRWGEKKKKRKIMINEQSTENAERVEKITKRFKKKIIKIKT